MDKMVDSQFLPGRSGEAGLGMYASFLKIALSAG
jgi:imidazoleglycerol phosphate synthase glutamine amidotransferase subunit HisH